MKQNERNICGYGFLLGIVAIAWGSLILPHALGLLIMAQFTIYDGVFLLIAGAILCSFTLKYYQILSQQKWYEFLNKEVR